MPRDPSRALRQRQHGIELLGGPADGTIVWPEAYPPPALLVFGGEEYWRTDLHSRQALTYVHRRLFDPPRRPVTDLGHASDAAA